MDFYRVFKHGEHEPDTFFAQGSYTVAGTLVFYDEQHNTVRRYHNDSVANVVAGAPPVDLSVPVYALPEDERPRPRTGREERATKEAKAVEKAFDEAR